MGVEGGSERVWLRHVCCASSAVPQAALLQGSKSALDTRKMQCTRIDSSAEQEENKFIYSADSRPEATELLRTHITHRKAISLFW